MSPSGIPLLDDGYARELHQQATKAGWIVQVEAAPSLLEQAYATLALGSDPHTVVSGPEPIQRAAETGLLVLAANAPFRLLQGTKRYYPETHEVEMLTFAGEPTLGIRRMLLGEAIAYRPDALLIPPLTNLARLQEPATLRWIMARLRAPDGCPWDQEQTHQTLKKHLLEETAEVLDALDEEDMVALREELGDLLLQVLLSGTDCRGTGRLHLR